jgi:hypothetical protein
MPAKESLLLKQEPEGVTKNQRLEDVGTATRSDRLYNYSCHGSRDQTNVPNITVEYVMSIKK